MKSYQNNKRAHEAGWIALWCVLGLLAFGAAAALFAVTLADNIKRERAEQTAEIVVNGSGAVAVIDHEEFFETDTPAEGVGYVAETAPVRDICAPDWNLNTSRVGWDGRLMEEWELDLFARIFYKEFWGASIPCCEAGCDAMLNLWTSGLYGATMGEVLSATNDNGYYMFSTYPTVWETVYDADGLAWCRDFCLRRFLSGPTWVDAMYFKLWGYHDTSWSIPLYEIDGVYFSMGKEW